MEELKLYRSVRTNIHSQGWGENKACINPNSGQVVTKTNNTCPIDFISFYDEYLHMFGHNGDDWTTYFKESIYHSANFEGWVKTEVDEHGGIGVRVISNSPVRLKNGEETYVSKLYWHNYKVLVHDGQQVKPGDILAWSDSTGASSGNHVHDSQKYCDEYGNTQRKDNGMYGCFSPELGNFENKFILDALNEEIAKELQTAIATGTPTTAVLIQERLTLTQLALKVAFLLLNTLKGRLSE